MLSYFWRSKSATATPEAASQSRPIETFQELYNAIHVMSKLKEVIFGGNSPEVGAQSTKIAILQALMTKVGHEGVAAQESLDELRPTLDSLSESSLARVVGDEGEIGLERRQLVRRILGVILKNDAIIVTALQRLGQSKETIDGLLMESDYAMLFEVLNSMGLDIHDPAMAAIKAYLVSARTILHEAQFGLFEELDFIFPNEIRLAPSPKESRREEDAAPSVPLPPPMPPTAQARALRSQEKAAARDSRVTKVDSKAFALQENLILELQSPRRLKHVSAEQQRTSPTKESDRDKHLRSIREAAREAAASRQKGRKADVVADQSPSAPTIKIP